MTASRRVSLIVAALVFAGGAASFAGWAFHLPRLTDWTGSGITIKTNPSLLIAAAAIALFCFSLTPRLRAVTAVLGVFVASVALLTMLEHLLGLNFGIDTLLFDEPPGAAATVSPNRMGLPASIALTLSGIVLCLRATNRGTRLAVGFALCGFALGMLSLTGHWYQAKAIYMLPRVTAIAAQTAVLLVLLTTGLIAAFPEHEPGRTIFADDSAGALVRRLLPFLIGVPMVLGWTRLEGQRLGWYDAAFGTAVRTWFEVAILAGMTWWAIKAIRRREAAQAEAEAALREADRRKDAFLATLSHELRNPLSPIRNSATLLTIEGALPPKQQWAAEVIERQVRHMARLLDDLLDVSRITRDRLELRRARLDVNDAVRAAIETSRPLIDAAGHELSIELSPQPLEVDGDVDRLAQVFSNLLNNAARYTPRGGHIWIGTHREGEQVVVRVRDDGIGIEADAMPGVFEMFVQANSVLHEAQGGLGIGLSLARGFVELHGGRLEGYSGGTGKGCEFTVRLPALLQ